MQECTLIPMTPEGVWVPNQRLIEEKKKQRGWGWKVCRLRENTAVFPASSSSASTPHFVKPQKSKLKVTLMLNLFPTVAHEHIYIYIIKSKSLNGLNHQSKKEIKIQKEIKIIIMKQKWIKMHT